MQLLRPILLSLLLPFLCTAEEEPSLESLLKTAMEKKAKGEFLGAAEALAAAALKQPGNPNLHNAAGEYYFFATRPTRSLEQFDKAVALEPQSEPYHWQRGISQYYTGKFAEGVAQFELHKTVNGSDVENSAFHFICVAKAESPEAARKKLIPVEGDSRVPMAQIQQMFAGELTPAQVVEAAGEDKNHLCYAHLYAALYLEALGKDEESLAHAKKAAVDYKQDHYMGQVAQVHFRLRKKKEDPPKPAPESD